MAEPFLGEIRAFGFTFAPRGWAMCNGQTLAIAQNQALFSLLGTTYGGNGVTTFQLPNLQGRVAVSFGQGLGLSNYSLGQTGGEAAHSLTTQEMPSHNHVFACKSTTDNSGTPTSPVNNSWAKENNGDAPYRQTIDTPVSMGPSTIANAGGGQPHTNLQPYLVLNFCIALLGVFPSRN
jgi:microcystin-dependent protein